MADLKTIITLNQDELRRSVPIREALTAALSSLSSREADVLQRRAGLTNGQTETLAEIGKALGVTRERVRQIESAARQKLAEAATNPPLSAIIAVAMTEIRERGGIVAQQVLENEFLPKSQQGPIGNASLVLLLELVPDIRRLPETKQLRACYALSASHEQALSDTVKALKGTLQEAKHPLTVAELSEKVTAAEIGDFGHLLTDVLLESSLQAGTQFVPVEDKWGLATWRDINPRNIRDKTLYMLKQVGTPLHFTDIAERIRTAKFDHKRVTDQAVHNELINGGEFVLIGRGIYALKDWGYIEGTVADVIADVLQKADGPLEREAIVEAVLAQRQVSRNTILINLQDTRFQHDAEKRYRLSTVEG